MADIENRKYVVMPLRSVLLDLLTISLWLMEVVLVLGSIITAGQWPAAIKTYVCLTLAVLGSICHLTRRESFSAELRRRRIEQLASSNEIVLRPIEYAQVVVFVIAVGAFGTWLVWGPP